MTTKIGLIGAGNMAEALVKGIISAQLAPCQDIVLADINQQRLKAISKTYGTAFVSTNEEVVDQSDIIILAVKPQNIAEVLKQITSKINEKKLLISIAAGVQLSLLKSSLSKDTRIIRVMPNTPALVLSGMTAICSDGVSEDDLKTAERIFSAIGKIVVVKEVYIDAITGLSGSGPAYVAVIIEALTDGGVLMGLPRNIAQELVMQTISGTVRLISETKEHPCLIKDKVTSPGGTTIHGLYALEKGGLRATLMSAVKAASLRSQELGKK